jgi:hypothetical protein
VNFLHSESHLDRGDIAVVTLDSQANVMLMDDINSSASLWSPGNRTRPADRQQRIDVTDKIERPFILIGRS